MSSGGVGSGLSHNTVSIGATAALIVAGRTTRKSVIVQNVHATQILYVGGSEVTTANGLQVRSNESLTFDDCNGPIYGIASGAATDVRYLEVY